MTDQELKTWLGAWRDTYDLRHDEVLTHLRGPASFSKSDVEAVIRWKYYGNLNGREQYRLQVALERLGTCKYSEVKQITESAFADPDDARALETIRRLPGIGAALASAILMAQNPERYTAWDKRAPQSLEAFGYSGVFNDTPSCWLRYLRGCRDVAMRSGHTLRDVDRALFCANGDIRLPAGEGNRSEAGPHQHHFPPQVSSVQVSQQGYNRMVQELNALRKVRRPKIREQIPRARQHGDLSEKSDYRIAKAESS